MRLRIPEAKLAGMQREPPRSLFASRQMDPRKTFQLPPWPRGATGALVRIELHDLIPSNGSCVLNVNGCGQRFLAMHRRGIYLEIRKLEAGIAEPITKGVQRSAGAVPVAGIRFIWNLSQVLRVVNRNLPNAAGPCDRELASGRGLDGKQVRNRVAYLR